MSPAPACSPTRRVPCGRPTGAGWRQLAGRDSYGDGKLSSEELLRSRAVPHLVLRLPDVIGPRDTTRRWWAYQLWVQYAGVLRRPVPIPPSAQTLRTSYVFVSGRGARTNVRAKPSEGAERTGVQSGARP